MSIPWILAVSRLPEDSGWDGPDTVYLLCYAYRIDDDGCSVDREPEFLARVTPDPDWSIQRWRKGVCVQFHEKPGRSLHYDVKELTEGEASVYIAFKLIPVHDIDGREISSFD